MVARVAALRCASVPKTIALARAARASSASVASIASHATGSQISYEPLPALVHVHAHETGRQLASIWMRSVPDAVARRAPQHLVAEPVVADAAHHRHRRARRAQVAGDVERCAAEEEPLGQGIPEHLADAEHLAGGLGDRSGRRGASRGT